ncbi:MAG: hypothetical protein WHS87_00125 [Anaerolineales bacterium]
MSETSPLPFRPLILPFLLSILFGWGGVSLIVLYTPPTAGWRWLFFFCWVLAWSGSALPLLYLIHRLFPSAGMDFSILGRQALWVGLYGALLAWLQLGRMLNLPLALEIATLLIVVEWLLRWREQARRETPPTATEPPDIESASTPTVNDELQRPFTE